MTLKTKSHGEYKIQNFQIEVNNFISKYRQRFSLKVRAEEPEPY